MRVTHDGRLDALGRHVIRSVTDDGYCVVGAPLALEEFYRLAGALGNVIQETEIAVKPGSRRAFESPEAVSLHTEPRRANSVAWLCRRPASRGGDTLLLDTRPIVEALPDLQRRLLEDAWIETPSVNGTLQPAERTLTRMDGRMSLYYIPWLVRRDGPPAPIAALDVLERAFNRARPSAMSVHLREGDALFIDNGRMLHGRTAIDDDAADRSLLRLYVARPSRVGHLRP